MGKVIAVANQKGGVAKTTSAHNIAVALSIMGKKTLMVDLDSQASLTICAGLEPTAAADNNIVSVLTDEESRKRPIRECIHDIVIGKYRTENCFILPSIIDLADLEWKLFSKVSREMVLRRALAPIRDEYDFIIIDCPPQLSILTINALSCADGVIIPVKTDYLSYRGLAHLKNTIADIKELTNPGLQIYGILATMYEKRAKYDTEILMLLNRENKILAVLNKRVWAGKGVYDGMAVVELNPSLDISLAYTEVAEMIVADKYTGIGETER